MLLMEISASRSATWKTPPPCSFVPRPIMTDDPSTHSGLIRLYESQFLFFKLKKKETCKLTEKKWKLFSHLHTRKIRPVFFCVKEEVKQRKKNSEQSAGSFWCPHYWHLGKLILPEGGRRVKGFRPELRSMLYCNRQCVNGCCHRACIPADAVAFALSLSLSSKASCFYETWFHPFICLIYPKIT